MDRALLLSMLLLLPGAACESGAPTPAPEGELVTLHWALGGPCSVDEDCEDDNPCNLDRCLGEVCRFSEDVEWWEGCCFEDGQCDDGSACTVDHCLVEEQSCGPPSPIELGPGEVCCDTDADCEDGDPSNLDICDGNENPKICIHPGGWYGCDSVDDSCDDGAECTGDYRVVATKNCMHALIPGCCQKNSQCPEDGDPCTVGLCHYTTRTCTQLPILGCCSLDDQCDNGEPCTEDLCTPSNVCPPPRRPLRCR